MALKAEHAVVVATRRTAIRCLVQEARTASGVPFRIEEIALDPSTVTAGDPRTRAAAVAVVDMGGDAACAIDFCLALRAVRPQLPITALVCCTHAFTSMHMQRLLQIEGPMSIVDAEASVGELVRSIDSLLEGKNSIHLRMRAGFDHLLDMLVPRLDPRRAHPVQAPARRDLDLIGLVAQGLSDREIGLRLHLSRHTIHHRIERLRDDLQLKNRTELAAWAGRHGMYTPDCDDDNPG